MADHTTTWIAGATALMMALGCATASATPATVDARSVTSAPSSATRASPRPGRRRPRRQRTCSLLVRAFAVNVPARALETLGLWATANRGVAVDGRGRGASFRRWRFVDYEWLLDKLRGMGQDPPFANVTFRLQLGKHARMVGGGSQPRRAAMTVTAKPAIGGLAMDVGLHLGATGGSYIVDRPKAVSRSSRTLLRAAPILVKEPGTLVLFTETTRRARRYIVTAMRYRAEPGCPVAGRSPVQVRER